MKILIDTDIGDDVDDILALAFALKRPELDIVGISTVVGDVDCRSRMVDKLLSIMGRKDIPIAAGQSLPLIPEKANLKRLEGTPWQGSFAEDVESRSWPDAVPFIVDAANRYGHELGIVTIGPVSNVGAALQLDPDLGRKVGFIACMAASADPKRREYNAAFDPEAFDLVLKSKAKLFMGTWETTRKVFLDSDVQQKIAQLGTKLGEALATNIELWRPVQGSKPGPVMYDLAPIIWAFKPDLYPTQPRRMSMVLEGEDRGTTPVTVENPNVELCVDVKSDEVLKLFLDTLFDEGDSAWAASSL